SAYLRLSTRPVSQKLAAIPADPAARERRRRQVVAGAYPLLRASGGPAVTIAVMGALVPEALAAAERLAETGTPADVVCVTSPGPGPECPSLNGINLIRPLLRTDGAGRAPGRERGAMDEGQGRLLNVSLLAGSGAHRAYYDRSGSSVSELTADELASGFPPRPALNLHYFGGRTITHLVFANHYLGGSAAWAQADIASIDAALVKAMSDTDLQSVIQQY